MFIFNPSETTVLLYLTFQEGPVFLKPLWHHLSSMTIHIAASFSEAFTTMNCLIC